MYPGSTREYVTLIAYIYRGGATGGGGGGKGDKSPP